MSRSTPHRPTPAPCGSWSSPITSDLVATAAVEIVDVLLDGDDVCWIEGRPQEAGRRVLVRRHGDDGTATELTPAPFSARTTVHEYGGAAALVAAGTICFSDFRDQRLYRLDPGGRPVALTPAPAPGEPAGALRYADGCIDPARQRWIGVREDHRAPGQEAASTIVSVDLRSGGPGTVLVAGHDFHAAPRLSPDGRRLAWLAWKHPHMPWAATELWVGDLSGTGIENPTRVAGGPGESVFQPEWSPDGVLHFVSDRSGWWNLYRCDAQGAVVNLCPRDAEFGRPQWTLGMSTYAFVSAGEVVCSYIEGGLGKLARLEIASGRLTDFDLPFVEFSSVRAHGSRVAFKAGAPTIPASVVLLDARSGRATTLRQSTALADDPAIRAHFSAPEPIAFPTTEGDTAFALFYPPCNPDHAAPAGELPPLLVRCHGGPTSSAARTLDLRTQFWTSRGIAVADVDYRGSTGYGRAYRERLQGRWGVVDAADCAAAARFLAAQGRVDAGRTVISGSSAGGFTTLACLTHADPAIRGLFRAGGSHYGVSDPEALARDTHKFESRYLDWLIAPWTDAADAALQAANRQRYLDRSPVHHADRLSAPVAFFQGAEDRIVPPSQTERMVGALRAKGITAQYLLFAGEQHGFRQAANIRWALDAEFYFFDTLVFRSQGRR